MSAEAAPPLQVRTPVAQRTLPAGRVYHVGRDPQADIVLADSRVSWRHATLRFDGSRWLLEDGGSTNGTFLGRDRVQNVPIAAPCVIRLGHPDDGPAIEFTVPVAPPPLGRPPAAYADPPGRAAPQHPAVPRQRLQDRARPAPPGAPRLRSADRLPSAVMQLPATLLRIGRAPDNQVVIDDLSVSRYHAELRRDPARGYSIIDLGSHNGTFLNGQRITAAPVTERDIIGIGPATYRLVGEQLQEFLDTGDISLVAYDLCVRLASGKMLMDHVTFPLGQRCLLGVIGPSGAGKSTLLGALTGIRPATTGTVFYDERDLYTHYDELRHRIGLVPQEDILHTQLTGRKALRYAAELRFPPDTSSAERNHRIDEVLGELSLNAHADTPISALSGGQRKRVNVALELLTKPSLLFLDEPTSGLDPGLDKSVMEQMAHLAHDGRTIIVVTHSVANLDLCDRLLVLVPGGKIAFFGAPKDGLRHFGQPGWAEVFQAFEAQPARDWAAEFRASPYYQQFITSALDGAAAGSRQLNAAPPPPHRSRNRFSQLSTLTRRYMSVIASDKVFLALLFVTPILLAGIIRLIPSPHGLTAGGSTGNSAATSLMLILVVGACFTGALNSIREIVKEKAIYARERAAGQSAGAYLGSKLIVLGVIGAIQAVLLVGVGLIGRPLPPHGSFLTGLPLVEIMIALAVVAVASMALGLLISTSVSTSEKSLPWLFLTVMVQVILTGGIFPVGGTAGLAQLAWLAPSRWGFGAFASTVNLSHIEPQAPHMVFDPVWRHDARTWLTDIGIGIGIFAGLSLLAWYRLQRQGPSRRR
jgi:ABC-type multidrug transport system ATPase subunit/pSer/pThr/pTyr-binding forkhead associated (FHA) protein